MFDPDYQKTISQLVFNGLRYRLGLTTCLELRQIADATLNAGIYSPSLVEAALDAEESLDKIGIAFEKALGELGLTLPNSQHECIWALLRHYIRQIADRDVEPITGLKGIMEVYWSCQLFEQSKDYVGDSHDIHKLIGAYWEYGEIWERSQNATYCKLPQEAISALDIIVIEDCRAWLNQHTNCFNTANKLSNIL